MVAPPLIGVLALQGGFDAHTRMLRRLGAEVREVRVPGDLAGLEGLVIPGGESTTMTLGIAREGLAEPLRALIAPAAAQPADGGLADGAPGNGAPVDGAPADSGPRDGAPADGAPGDGGLADGRPVDGIPVLGSCAGLIMLDRDHLGLMDMRARRNAFGRQIASFEADVALRGVGIPPAPPVRGIFIRAPWIEEHGPDVEILAELDGHAVAARQGALLAVAFHAELTDDLRVHQLFLDAVAARRARA